MKFIGHVSRILVALYPRAYRSHTSEIVEVITERLADRRRTAGWASSAVLAARELSDLLKVLGRTWMKVFPKAFLRRIELPGLRTVSTDVRHGLRGWTRRPGYVLTIVVTLAVGIGGSTAVFSIVNGILIRPLPYEAPHQLALIWSQFDTDPHTNTWVHDLQLRALKTEAGHLADFSAMRMVSGRILGGERPVHTDVARVSANFFDVLGIRAVLGRTFDTEEDASGAPWVAVLSHEYWTEEFDQDSSVIGTDLVIGFPSMRVIGVLPPAFDFRMYEALNEVVTPQIWIPHQINYDRWSDATPGSGVAVLARVREPYTLNQVADELNQLAARHASLFPEGVGLRYQTIGLQDAVVGKVRPGLTFLLISVCSLLLLVVVNVSTLVLAQAQYRVREFSLRGSLGASNGRLFTQLFIESVLPACAGTVMGVLLARFGVTLLLAVIPPGLLPLSTGAPLDLSVLGFAMTAGFVAGIVPGILPGLFAGRVNNPTMSQERSSHMTASRANTIRDALVVVQVSLSVLLFGGAALTARSLLRVLETDPGFSREGVLTFSTYLMQEYDSREKRDRFFGELATRISRLPDVVAVGATTALPLSETSFGPVFRHEQPTAIRYSTWPGQGVALENISAVEDAVLSDINAARPGYFQAAGIPIVSGRDFDELDGQANRPHIVVDEHLANTFWPDQPPVGKQLWVFNTWATVVGVVRHTQHRTLGEDGRPQLYIPYAVLPNTHRTSVVVRTTGDPLKLVTGIRSTMRELDPTVPIGEIETMDARLRRATVGNRFLSGVMATFASIAALLAALGIYSVLAFHVARRRRELATRVALGANRGQVALLVASHALRLTAFGAMVAVSFAQLVAMRLDERYVDFSVTDPFILLSVFAATTVLTVMAAWGPTRQAVTVEPVITLRSP